MALQRYERPLPVSLTDKQFKLLELLASAERFKTHPTWSQMRAAIGTPHMQTIKTILDRLEGLKMIIRDRSRPHRAPTIIHVTAVGLDSLDRNRNQPRKGTAYGQ